MESLWPASQETHTTLTPSVWASNLKITSQAAHHKYINKAIQQNKTVPVSDTAKYLCRYEKQG